MTQSRVQFTTLQPAFMDRRGHITNIVEGPESMLHVATYFTHKDAIRGNHYHLSGLEVFLLLSGSCEFVFKDPRDPAFEERYTLGPGDRLRYEATLAHAVRFLEDSTALSCSTFTKEQSRYGEHTFPFTVIE